MVSTVMGTNCQIQLYKRPRVAEFALNYIRIFQGKPFNQSMTPNDWTDRRTSKMAGLKFWLTRCALASPYPERRIGG